MNRPKVICHMLSSVDGRIDVGRWTLPYDTEKSNLVKAYGNIHEKMDVQAIVEGRKTVQQDFVTGEFPYSDYSPAQTFETYIAPHTSQRFFVVVDPQGKIFYEQSQIRGNDIIVVLGEQVSDEYISHLKELGISHLFAGSDGRDLNIMLTTLKEEFAIDTLLLQGGGIINGSFLKAGLIDELSLMIYPGVDGLTLSPTLFDFTDDKNGIHKNLSLKLTDCEIIDEAVVWLNYSVHKSN